MANLWHDLPIGPGSDLMTVYMVVETPKRSRNKYEYDTQHSVMRLDRVLYSSLHYPGDYGFVPRTKYDDGDPLDVLVMTSEPTFPGCLIEARPVGIFHMRDAGFPDDKILAVPACDPLFEQYRELRDIPSHFLEEVRHFFLVYKDLQRIPVEILGWEDRAAALDEIARAAAAYVEAFGHTGPRG